MPKVKIPRKSTWVDMTAFVDVAFLILSFFILTTKFKPDDPVPVTTPSSVSSKTLDQVEKSFVILIDKDGKVYAQLPDDKEKRKAIIQNLNTTRNLGLTPEEISKFLTLSNIGVSYEQLKPLLSKSKDEIMKVKQPGMPVDSTGGDLQFWVRDLITVYSGDKLLIFVKGDNATKYPAFNHVLKALKKNNQFKFSLITDPEMVPAGSELDISNSKKK